MTLETIADLRLHPATFYICIIRSLPQYVLGMPAILGFMSNSSFYAVALFAVAGLTAAALGAYVSWRRFTSGVGTQELVIQSGVFNRQRRVIPFDRVQDIDIEQGPLARLFGTAKVRIETGGGAKDEGSLDSIGLAEAHQLREILRRRAPTELAEEQAPEDIAEPLVFAMELKRVALSGLLNFSLIYIAVVFGSFKYIEAFFGVDVLAMDWVEPARALVGVATWGASLLAIVLVLLLSLVTGVLRTIARDYGFRLTRSPGGLRRRRGLFTLSEALIPLRRVQLSIIQSGPVARLLGWYRLELQTLSADADAGGNQVDVPFGRDRDIQQALAEVSSEAVPPTEDYTGVSRRHIIRQSLRWSALLVLPILGASIASPFALGLFGLLPLLIAAAALQWRHHRFFMTPTNLYVRHGVLSQRLWILPYERIQVLAVDQGPLQRRLGLATLAVDTAGASAMRPLHVVNLPVRQANALSDELLGRQRIARAALESRHSVSPTVT